MKKANLYFYSLLCLLIVSSVIIISGCGGAASGGGGTPAPTPFVADIYVATTGSDETGDGSINNPYKTINKAMGVVGTGEVIGVRNGVYADGEILWTLTAEGVTLRGESAQLTTLEGSSRVINIPGSVPFSQSITIEGITIKNGTLPSDFGAGIFCYTTITLNLKNAILRDNSANRGGAVYIGNGCDLNVEDCSFVDNKAYNNSIVYGGAIHTAGASILTATNCTFEGNYTIDGSPVSQKGGALYLGDNTSISDCTFTSNITSGDGGAIYANGDLTIEATTFSGNTVESDGGAVYISNAKLLKLTDCTFSSNTAETGFGGAIYAGNGPIAATNCTFQNNSALGVSGGGGGMFSSNTTVNGVVITGSTFTGNSANTGGGAYVNEADMTKCVFADNSSSQNAGGLYMYLGGRMENCLMYNNIAGGNSGALFQYSCTLEAVNCTIVSNEAPSSPGIFVSSGPGRTTTIKNCIVWGNVGSGAQITVMDTAEVVYSDVMNGYAGTGNQNLYPNFADYPPTGNNDLKLTSSTSSLIAAGGTTEEAPSDDFDGNLRTDPYSMGAFEQDSYTP